MDKLVERYQDTAAMMLASVHPEIDVARAIAHYEVRIQALEAEIAGVREALEDAASNLHCANSLIKTIGGRKSIAVECAEERARAILHRGEVGGSPEG